ncbi:hypothetical protein QUW37_06525 [Ligilactobacillus aviarius]|uniref:hypothetical protein n=1 Tax=Ligilactobacillus TaxID=2767887 RepID=UPI0025A39C32|nr:MULTISPECIES: hypothetical protein [Ligilactobacillus]MDM8278884.1 hypothetical protein [Ligilactobacillus aviarius]MDO3394028.1 hypothetical protein [Ligilactobacillus sp. 110_WCHN]
MVCILAALISSTSRGVISVIDRYQMGYRKGNLLVVNFINNILATILATIVLVVLQHFVSLDFLLLPQQWFRIIIYALLVQLVAYGYSYLYRHLPLIDAVISGKVSDIFIPLALALTTSYFSFRQYSVSLISTLLVGLLAFSPSTKKVGFKTWIRGILVIVPLLTVQSALSPILVNDIHGIPELMGFTIITIYLRLIISFISLFTSSKNKLFNKDSNGIEKTAVIAYGLRSVLTIAAQISFTIATASKASGIAWVLLNMTSLYGVVFGSWILKEKIGKFDVLVLLVVTVMTLLTR